MPWSRARSIIFLATASRTSGQRGDDRGVDRKGGVGDRLHDLNGCGQDGGFVGQRDAGVDVQHMGAGRQLGVGIVDHA
ncbi:MAG: hypothetical protein NTV69_17245 [Caldilinea sp.]|nr:hypothetical protein [Caldilinea sp.]